MPTSLLDIGANAAIGLAKQKLSAPVSQAVDLGQTLFKRFTEGPGNPLANAGKPGQKDPLRAMQGRSDPLMNFNWWCDMPIINSSTQLGWEFVEEAQLPFITFEQVSNYRAGKNYHFAQKYNLGNLNLKFYEDSKATVANYISDWQGMILNAKSGLFYFPKDYKKTISIWVLDVAKLTVMCLDYTGCWPLTPETYNFGSSSSERIVAGCEFSVDSLEIKFGKFDSSDIPSMMSTVGNSFPPKLSALPDVFPSKFVNLSFGGLGSSVNSQISGAISSAKNSLSGLLG